LTRDGAPLLGTAPARRTPARDDRAGRTECEGVLTFDVIGINYPAMKQTETLLTPLLRDLAPDVTRRLGMIVSGLLAVVARRFLREPHLIGLSVPLYNRLSRAVQRFGRVMARLAAGRPPRPAGVARMQRSEIRDLPTADRPAPARDPLPRGRDWLVRELGWEAAGFGSQLEHMLREPEIAALLAASPAACRILRPLCRMLAVHDDALPPAPKRARAAAPATLKPKPARAAPRRRYRAATPPPSPTPTTSPAPADAVWPWLVPRPVWRLP
jgi:hypothetical protein